MPPSAGKHPGLRRLADKGRFKMVAIDRRTPLRGPIAATRGTAEAPYEDVVAVKERLAVPWTGHPSFARDAAVAFAGPSFPEDYPAC